MATTQRIRDIAAERARRAVVDFGRDARDARRLANLSQEQVSKVVGISHGHLSRIRARPGPESLDRSCDQDRGCRWARPFDPDVSWRRSDPRCRPGSAARTFSVARGADPLLANRDPGRAGRRSTRLGWRPHGARSAAGVEAVVHVHDWQALDRRISLRRRDLGIQLVILVLADTRHNRAVLRSLGPGPHDRLPAERSDGSRRLARGTTAGVERDRSRLKPQLTAAPIRRAPPPPRRWPRRRAARAGRSRRRRTVQAATASPAARARASGAAVDGMPLDGDPRQPSSTAVAIVAADRSTAFSQRGQVGASRRSARAPPARTTRRRLARDRAPGRPTRTSNAPRPGSPLSSTSRNARRGQRREHGTRASGRRVVSSSSAVSSSTRRSDALDARRASHRG